jgi:hypothetical protein
VAPRAVHDYWRAEIEQQFPDYHLVETEEVQLVPYAPGGKTKKDAAADLDHLDFLVSERHGAAERPLFHIELKTGPSSIEAMKEFQLDVNDSNDIAGAVNLTQLPAYIFHVQVDFEYDPPPTRKGVARGVWWTDVVTLGENLKEVKARRGEDKKAGYYHTAAFQPIATFADELTAKRFEQLQVRVRQVPLELLGA